MIKKVNQAIYDFFIPSERNHFIPRALGARAFFYYIYVMGVVALLLFSPLTNSFSFRVFLANLSQELILAQTNPAREAEGAAPLRVDPLLSQAARMKAEDMIARNYFAHIGPNGELPWKWIENMGYKYSAAGENLAIDFSDPTALVNAWLASPTHAANMKNGVFTDVGIGIADGVFEGRKTSVVVMFLGRKVAPSSAIAVKPVVKPKTVVSLPTSAVRADTPLLTQKVLSLETEDTPKIQLADPLVVNTEAPVENSQEVASAVPHEVPNTPSVGGITTAGFLFLDAPGLTRAALTVFFGAMFLFAVFAFIRNKSWAPLMLSRTSALLLLVSIIWLPTILY